MKQLYSARNGQQAHEVRLFLESQGIAAKVFGDSPVLESIGAFTPASVPSVYVDEADFEQAAVALEQFQDQATAAPVEGTWTCAACGETSEAPFEICWNCEAPARICLSHQRATIPAPSPIPQMR